MEHPVKKEVLGCLKFEQKLLKCYSLIETLALQLNLDSITMELDSFTNELMTNIDKKIELSDEEVWNQNNDSSVKIDNYLVVQEYEEIIKMKPKYEAAWRNKIFALVMTCNLEEALKVCIDGLKCFPESSELKSIKKIIEDSFQSEKKPNLNA